MTPRRREHHRAVRLLKTIGVALLPLISTQAIGAAISVTAAGTYQLIDHALPRPGPTRNGTDTSTQFGVTYSGNGYALYSQYEWSDMYVTVSPFIYDTNLCATTVGDQLPGGGTMTYPGGQISKLDLQNLPPMVTMTKIKPYCHTYTLSGSVKLASEYIPSVPNARLDGVLVIQNDDGAKYRNNLFGPDFSVPYGTCSAEVNNVDLGELHTGENIINELPVSVTSEQASKVVFTSADLDADGVLHLGSNKKILVTTNKENIDGSGNWWSSEKNIPLRIQVDKDATPGVYTSSLIATVSCI